MWAIVVCNNKEKKEAAAAATKSYAQAQALALEGYKHVEHLLQLHYYTGLGPFTNKLYSILLGHSLTYLAQKYTYSPFYRSYNRWVLN